MQETSSLDCTLEHEVNAGAHPRIILKTLELKRQLATIPEEINLKDFSYQCFEDLSSAEKAHPEVKLKFVGRPWGIYQLLESGLKEAIIDFQSLGSVYLAPFGKEWERGGEQHDHLLPLWLNYALSPDLWGPVGKWTRFHERLMNLFNQHNLLDGKASLGYYPLKEEAKKLESMGLQGTLLNKGFLLVLPWTFSLTDLNKLEAFVEQEF